MQFRPILALIICCFSAPAFGQFGRYVGVLNHAGVEQDQLAKLDFIVSRQSPEALELQAVLSLYFGDFESKEYVSYYFANVRLNIVTGALVFADPTQDLTIVVERFRDGQLTGQVRSTAAGSIGNLSLVLGDVATPDRALVQPVWGEYRGSCDGITTILQVQSSRNNTNDGVIGGSPFATYSLTAQLAEVNGSGCGDTSVCVTSVYTGGDYDFYHGRLNLQGRSRGLSCTVESDGLSCNSCSLKRVSSEAAQVGAKTFPRFENVLPAIPEPGRDSPAAPEPASLSGLYSGHLHHEKLDRYQAATLNLVTYQGQGNNGQSALFVSAVGSLSFGDHTSTENLTYRFAEKEFALLAPQIVLASSSAETIVQLTQLGNGTARGIWYSKAFGRIGEFELQQGDPRPLPPGVKSLQPLTGRYHGGGGWVIDLRVLRSSQAEDTQINPFAPLKFSGTFRLSDITRNIEISGGAFDFYSGKLSFILENESIFTGTRDDDGFALKRPTPGAMRPLLPHGRQAFVRIPQ